MPAVSVHADWSTVNPQAASGGALSLPLALPERIGLAPRRSKARHSFRRQPSRRRKAGQTRQRTWRRVWPGVDHEALRRIKQCRANASEATVRKHGNVRMGAATGSDVMRSTSPLMASIVYTGVWPSSSAVTISCLPSLLHPARCGQRSQSPASSCSVPLANVDQRQRRAHHGLRRTEAAYGGKRRAVGREVYRLVADIGCGTKYCLLCRGDINQQDRGIDHPVGPWGLPRDSHRVPSADTSNCGSMANSRCATGVRSTRFVPSAE